MKNNTYCVSCDWYAISVDCPWAADLVLCDPAQTKSMPMPNSAKNTPTKSEDNTLRDILERPVHKMEVRQVEGLTYTYGGETFLAVGTDQFNPAFSKSCAIKYKGAIFAHVFYDPRHPSVSRTAAQVKLDNSALYNTHWPTILHAMLRACSMRFVRVVRVDVCADFEYFANGRLPLRFCQDYLSKPTHARPTFVRKSSNKLACRVTKKYDKLLWETLSWGSRDSAVQVNLYNKTLELQTKHDKPWIRAKWREYGLPDDITSGTKRYVWRVEFSLNPSAKFITAKPKRGEKDSDGWFRRLREIQQSDVDSQRALDSMFAALLPDYFQFYYLYPDDVRAHRSVKDLTPVVLFTEVDKAEFRLRGYKPVHSCPQRLPRLLSAIDDFLETESMTDTELNAMRQLRERVADAYGVERNREQGELRADDVLLGFLQGLRPMRACNVFQSPAQKHRELERYLGMLKAAGDPTLKRFTTGYRELDMQLAAIEDDIKALADGLPDWFFDATDILADDTMDDDEWASIAKSMPMSDSA